MIAVDAEKLHIALLTSETHSRHYLVTGWHWQCLEFRVSQNTCMYTQWILLPPHIRNSSESADMFEK